MFYYYNFIFRILQSIFPQPLLLGSIGIMLKKEKIMVWLRCEVNTIIFSDETPGDALAKWPDDYDMTIFWKLICNAIMAIAMWWDPLLKKVVIITIKLFDGFTHTNTYMYSAVQFA